jgi:hypothetical protein
MAYILGLLIALLGVGVVVTVQSFFRLKTALNREYRKSTDGFFDAVEPLVSDDETPVEVLELIDMMNKSITDRRSALMLCSFLADSRWRQFEPSPRNKVRVEFFHRRPELESPFHEAIYNWFMAVTALSPFFGKVVRLIMDERNVERAVNVASAKVAKRHRDGNHNACPPQLRAAGI